MDDKGSTLVLLLIVIALISLLAASLINILFANYDIKRFNTEDKRAFYLSENGLNESYIITRKLIDEAIVDSSRKAEEYIFEFPLKEEEANDIFIINCQQYIIANIKNRINSHRNPSVEVRSLKVDKDMLNINILLRSTYVSEKNLVKITWLELIAILPEFDHIRDGRYDIGDYIEFGDWGS